MAPPARNIVDYLIDYGRDQLGYYPGPYTDTDGTWSLDRRYLFPASVQIMGQACAAVAILRVAQVTGATTPLATASPAATQAADLYPKPVTGTVVVVNSLSQTVPTTTAPAGTLDVSALAPGLYTISWQDGQQRVAKRFIKQAN